MSALAAAGAAAALPFGCRRSGAGDKEKEKSQTMPNVQAKAARMPVLFVGHGSPMNVIEDNAWSRGFASLREKVPRPSAILAISAHWYVAGTYLTGDAQPKTIHDFSGFPRALYEIEYRAPGKVDLAKRIRTLLGEKRASLRSDWGLDHGTWSVLRWMYPQADVPVVQLSIDRRRSAKAHYELGRSLLALRQEGVLIVGSGNVVHNLRHAISQMQSPIHQTPAWAKHFDEAVKQATSERATRSLLALSETKAGQQAHPTPDHWLPLIYAYAASDAQDKTAFPLEGFDLGSISMRSVLFS